MSLTKPEKETVVTMSDGDDLVRIWSAQGKYIRRLRKRPHVTEVRSGVYEGTEWAEFTVPADKYSPVTGVAQNRSPLSEEEKTRRAVQLQGSRTRPVSPTNTREETVDTPARVGEVPNGAVVFPFPQYESGNLSATEVAA